MRKIIEWRREIARENRDLKRRIAKLERQMDVLWNSPNNILAQEFYDIRKDSR